MAVNDEHKDRVFKFLFGNPANKAWTLAAEQGEGEMNVSDRV